MNVELIYADIEEIVVLPVGGAALEAYPHVLNKLNLFWGYPEFHSYVKTLMQSDKARQGFPVDVLVELVFLYELYKDNYKIINRSAMSELEEMAFKDTLGVNDIWAGYSPA